MTGERKTKPEQQFIAFMITNHHSFHEALRC